MRGVVNCNVIITARIERLHVTSQPRPSAILVHSADLLGIHNYGYLHSRWLFEAFRSGQRDIFKIEYQQSEQGEENKSWSSLLSAE